MTIRITGYSSMIEHLDNLMVLMKEIAKASRATCWDVLLDDPFQPCWVCSDCRPACMAHDHHGHYCIDLSDSFSQPDPDRNVSGHDRPCVDTA